MDNSFVPSVSLKDSSGTAVPPVKIRLNFRDLATPYPQGALAKKQLSEAVLRQQPDIDSGGSKKTLVTQGMYNIDVCGGFKDVQEILRLISEILVFYESSLM